MCVAQSEAKLNAKGYSVADEKRILDALGRGLLKEFPNPNRVGCPGADVLKKIASHEMPLSEAEKWLEHLGSCSPCYGDFSQFRDAHQRSRRRTLLAIAASILLVATVAGWALLRNRNENLATHTAILDLRNRSMARGTEPQPGEPPLQVSRNVSHLEIYLPLGSSDGAYDVRLTDLRGEAFFAGAGTAEVQQGVTLLPVHISLAAASPGLYVLQLRKVGSEWNSYPLRIK